LTNREISRKTARNAMLPTLDLVAYYGGAGLAGVQNPALASQPTTPITTSGFIDALSRGFNGSAPQYSVGFSMNIPLRNRAAQSDQVRSELEFRQAELRLRQLQNQIRIEVKNAQYAAQQNRARVESATKARKLAQRMLDIEQKKLALGASTSLQVLQVGRDLAVAESNLVAALTSYAKSHVEMDRAVGMTLEQSHISMGDAENGQADHTPVVNGIEHRSQ
jgi:outer membrane protein TolC